MTKLKEKVSSPIKREYKTDTNMTVPISHKKEHLNNEIQNSIMRGELLRLSLYIDAVKENLKELKTSNPKYLKLFVDIIKLSINPLPVIDVDLPLDVLLKQLPQASFENQEALDFTQEVLNLADPLTSKYYLAHLTGGILQNLNLKKQFKASIPFVKYIATKSPDNHDLERQKNFMNAIKYLINEKADAKKIELLPRIKYALDNITKKDYEIDAIKIIYSKAPIKRIKQNIEALTKKDLTANFDYADYLIKNSL